MINLQRCLLLCCLVLAGSFLHAQVNDAQLWLSVNLEKKLTSSLSVGFSEEVRLNENMTEVGTVYSDLGLSYRFLKRFKAGASYRFSLKRRLDDTYEKFHSWYAECTFKEKFRPVSVLVRLRYQSRYDDPGTSEKAALSENHIRTKVTLKYDLDKKFEPYIFGEAFFGTGVPAAVSFDQLRLCTGIEYTFNRMHMIDLHYLIRREYNAKNPETDYVVGLGYYLKF
jgi:hypothetical protein